MPGQPLVLQDCEALHRRLSRRESGKIFVAEKVLTCLSKTYNCFAERGRCTYVAEVLTTNYTVSIRIVTNADTTTEIGSVSTRRRDNTVA